MSVNSKTFIVPETSANLRLDKFIAESMPEFSRSEIQKMEISGDKPGKIKLSDKVKPGEEYTIIIPDLSCTISPNLRTVAPDGDIDLDIMFEDADIIVVNKPRGLAMYPGAGRETDSVVGRVLSHTDLSCLGGEMRPGVVHRLDKDTSGAVVLAKSDAAQRALVKTFAAHDLTRKYIAFVWGVPNWEEADIEGNIGRSTKNRQKMTMLKVGGRPSKTTATVMNVWARENISQLRCTLFTGRTHQIRVHLSSHGFPVLCDPVYGRGTTRYGSVKTPELLEFLETHNGQMLHAEILEFAHPISGEALYFKARLPDDMRELKEILG